MLRVFKVARIEEIVLGTELHPGKQADADTLATWEVKDATACSWLILCVDDSLVPVLDKYNSSAEMWSYLRQRFEQVGSGSLMLWFRRIVKPFVLGGDVRQHVQDFEDATTQLACTGFEIPSYISSAILLSTLPSEPSDPASYYQFTNGVHIDKNTTLTSTVNRLLEHTRANTPSASTTSASPDSSFTTAERTLAAHGVRFCVNCQKTGHTKDYC
jgi:hypothetical protein